MLLSIRDFQEEPWTAGIWKCESVSHMLCFGGLTHSVSPGWLKCQASMGRPRVKATRQEPWPEWENLNGENDTMAVSVMTCQVNSQLKKHTIYCNLHSLSWTPRKIGMISTPCNVGLTCLPRNQMYECFLAACGLPACFSDPPSAVFRKPWQSQKDSIRQNADTEHELCCSRPCEAGPAKNFQLRTCFGMSVHRFLCHPKCKKLHVWLSGACSRGGPSAKHQQRCRTCYPVHPRLLAVQIGMHSLQASHIGIGEGPMPRCQPLQKQVLCFGALACGTFLQEPCDLKAAQPREGHCACSLPVLWLHLG